MVMFCTIKLQRKEEEEEEGGGGGNLPAPVSTHQ